MKGVLSAVMKLQDAPRHRCPNPCEVLVELREKAEAIQQIGSIEHGEGRLKVRSVDVFCSGATRPIQATMCHAFIEVIPVSRRIDPVIL